MKPVFIGVISFLLCLLLPNAVSETDRKFYFSEKQQISNASKKESSVKSEESFLPLYSSHWFGSMPWFSKENSVLLVHHIFVISFNLTTGFPDWVAYKLTPQIVWGNLKAERALKSDPLLAQAIKNDSFIKEIKSLLNFKDYKGASSFGYDKGHLAPKGSFKGSLFAFEAQYMTNIVPQKRDLNQGPWRMLEEKIRRFVLKGNRVKVLTGPLYGEALKGKKSYKKPLAVWPKAQGKIPQVPTGFWKMVFTRIKSSVKVCAFIIPQDLNGHNRKTSPKKFLIKIKDLQQFLPLNFQGIKRLKEDCRFLN